MTSFLHRMKSANGEWGRKKTFLCVNFPIPFFDSHSSPLPSLRYAQKKKVFFFIIYVNVCCKCKRHIHKGDLLLHSLFFVFIYFFCSCVDVFIHADHTTSSLSHMLKLFGTFIFLYFSPHFFLFVLYYETFFWKNEQVRNCYWKKAKNHECDWKSNFENRISIKVLSCYSFSRIVTANV